jgi:hypothetical protein
MPKLPGTPAYMRPPAAEPRPQAALPALPPFIPTSALPPVELRKAGDADYYATLARYESSGP